MNGPWMRWWRVTLAALAARTVMVTFLGRLRDGRRVLELAQGGAGRLELGHGVQVGPARLDHGLQCP